MAKVQMDKDRAQISGLRNSSLRERLGAVHPLLSGLGFRGNSKNRSIRSLVPPALRWPVHTIAGRVQWHCSHPFLSKAGEVLPQVLRRLSYAYKVCPLSVLLLAANQKGRDGIKLQSRRLRLTNKEIISHNVKHNPFTLL